MNKWYIKHFKELTPFELYALLRLRTEVFVVEQNCVFQDMDNKDQECYHVMGWNDEELVACSRIVPPGVIYEYPSIGRIVSSSSVRGKGAGKLLVEKSIEELEKLYGKTIIKIGAQYYLKKFYESFGFIQSSDIYDEDGIDHIKMIRNSL
jgi:ElaA protein